MVAFMSVSIGYCQLFEKNFIESLMLGCFYCVVFAVSQCSMQNHFGNGLVLNSKTYFLTKLSLGYKQVPLLRSMR